MSHDLQMRVTALHDEAAGIRRVRLEPVEGGPLPAFSGGAHVVVAMQDGDVTRRNPYSLCCDPEDRTGYEIAVARAATSRGGSAFIHERLGIGDVLVVGAPTNLFSPDWRAKKHILVAGGIGITPFVAMMAQFARAGLAFELHYAVRSRAAAAFAGVLQDRYGPRVKIYAADEGARLPLAALVENQPLGTHLYTCGPERLMDAVLDTARNAGWPEQALHSEHFMAPPPGDPFTVTLAESGREVAVGPDQSLLEALEAAGVNPRYLCRGGVCGECATKVVEFRGTILHADHFLTPEERAESRTIMICMSRFSGDRLVLNL